MKWKRLLSSALGLLLAAGAASPTVLAQDTSIDRYLPIDQNANYGRALSESPRGGSLAWGESYYTESYMKMYEATGDRFWLDKMVDHTDRMLANAVDHDGDGYKGWADFSYSHLQLANNGFLLQGAIPSTVETAVYGSFEAGAGASGVPTGWTLQGASGRAYRSTAPGDAFDGAAGVIVESDGVNQNRLVQPIAYTPGKSYAVEAYMSVDTEKTQALVEVYNATTNAVVAYARAHHVGFERYIFTFKAPASGSLQLRIGLQNYDQAGYKARFDGVSVKSLEHAPLQNGGMETVNGADPMLPASWARWHASTAANVYLSSDAHSGLNSIAVTTDNTSWEVAEQTIDYVPSESYTLSFWGKVSSTATTGRVEIYNATDGVMVAGANVAGTAWTSGSLTFTAPSAAGKTLKVRLYQNNWQLTGFTSYFDDLVLFSATPADELMANRGFDSASGTDATLPAGWTRASGTTASDAYLVSGINNAYSGTYGLAVKASPASDKTLEQTRTYTPGTTYVLSYWGRASNPNSPGRVDIYNETDGVVLSADTLTDLSWKQRFLTFTAPSAAGKTLKVRMTQPASGGGNLSYFDLTSLKPLLKTEAAGWTREAGTTLTAAHRSTDATLFSDGGGLELVHDGVSAPKTSQALLNYKPNDKYGLSFSGKVAAAGTTGQVRVYDKTTSTALGAWTFSNTDKLTIVAGDFQTPAAGHDLVVEVSIPSGSAGQTVWADSFTVGPYWEQMVHEGVIATPILRFVNAVYANAALHAAYSAKADTYRNFIADNLVHKWDPYWKQVSGTDGANNGTGVYIFPAGLSTNWFPSRSLPHNQYLAFASMLYLLYDATNGVPAYAADRSYYWSRANDMARAFRSKVRPNPLNASLGTDAYVWNYWDPMGSWDDGHYTYSSYTNEDISHAALTMSGAMEAYHHGQVFTSADMDKFTKTFTDVMWNQSLSDPVLSYYNSRRPAVTTDKINTNQFYAWSGFAEFNPLVWDIADAVCTTGSCTMAIASNLAKWSRNKTRNGDFELADPADATLPRGWQRWQSTSATAARTATGPGLNDWAVSIKTNGSTWQVMEQKLETYEPNTDYTISFLGKRLGSVNGRVQLFDYTTLTVLGELIFSDTSWTRKTFTARTPAAGHDVRLRLYTPTYTPVGQEVAFDDVRAYPSLAGTQIANAGFETADLWDAALPRYWMRGATTLDANAVIDTTDRSAGLSSLKIVSAGTGSQQELIYTWKGYMPGAAYSFSFDAQTAGAAGGRVQIVDTATNVVLVDESVSSASWTNVSAAFTAPSSYDHLLQVIVKLGNPGNAGSFRVDQLKLISQ